MTRHAGDDLADLSRIEDDGEHRHSASPPGAGHHVQLVNLGQKPRPGLPVLPVGGRDGQLRALNAFSIGAAASSVYRPDTRARIPPVGVTTRTAISFVDPMPSARVNAATSV